MRVLRRDTNCYIRGSNLHTLLPSLSHSLIWPLVGVDSTFQTHTCTLEHTLSHLLTHTVRIVTFKHTCALEHTLSHLLSLTYSLSLSHFLTLTLSHTYTHTCTLEHTHSLTYSHSRSHTHLYSPIHTHTHTHTHTLVHSHSSPYTRTLTHPPAPRTPSSHALLPSRCDLLHASLHASSSSSTQIHRQYREHISKLEAKLAAMRSSEAEAKGSV